MSSVLEYFQSLRSSQSPLNTFTPGTVCRLRSEQCCYSPSDIRVNLDHDLPGTHALLGHLKRLLYLSQSAFDNQWVRLCLIDSLGQRFSQELAPDLRPQVLSLVRRREP